MKGYDILSVIVILAELALIGFYIYQAVKKHKFINKGAIFYYLPLTVILFVLYVQGAAYNASLAGESLKLMECAKILKISVASMFFEGGEKYIASLTDVSILFNAAYLIAYMLSVVCVYTSVIGLVYDAILNQIRLWRALSGDCDILVGESEYNDTYIKNSKNVIVFTDSPKAAKAEHYAKAKIPYVAAPFNDENLFKSFAYAASKHKLNFISLGADEKNLGYINEFRKFAKREYKAPFGERCGKCVLDFKNITLKIEVEYGNEDGIRSLITKDTEFVSYISCYSRYELLGMNFAEENPITRSLPKDFINEELAVINPDKKINVIYIGFGKVCAAIHKAQLMNDALPTVGGKKLSQFGINYYAFDKRNEAADNKSFSYFSDRYDQNINAFTGDDYFESIPKINSLDFNPFNVHSYKFAHKLEEIVTSGSSSDNVFNRFIISFADDCENFDIAIKIEKTLKSLGLKNYEIFVKSDSNIAGMAKMLEGYDFKIMNVSDKIFNHDVLINDRICEIARLISGEYNAKSNTKSNWNDLSKFKQASNIYAAFNTRLKLNLIGYDYEKTDSICDNTAELNDIKGKLDLTAESYEDYLFFKGEKFSPANALSYQEHMRWNAFHVANGYIPMKKSDIKLIDANEFKFYKDDQTKKLHACLTTYEDLDVYHRHLAALLSAENGKTAEENLMNVNTYCYDYMLMEKIDNIFSNSTYKLAKRK